MPGATVIRFHHESQARGSYSLVTVPMAGYVAGDADGPVAETEAAPSGRWATLVPGTSPGGEATVSAHQMVGFLVERFGGAAAVGGIRGYSLDNEPGLWSRTHPRLHPEPVTVEELIERSVATAKAIKAADPDAEVYGPALWGMTAYVSLQQAADWPAIEEEGFSWFIDRYLQQMREASEREGQRLLDVLDVHWYTEDAKGRAWTGEEAMHVARSLYDPVYAEDTWVGRHFSRFLPLLPRLQAGIDAHYPGTKIAISEYDWPMTGTVYGGLAQADALGAFGLHGVYLAAYHHRVGKKPDRYVGAAFTLFRNYNGRGGGFGDTALRVRQDVAASRDLGAYASLDRPSGSLHVIVMNRAIDAATPLTLQVSGERAPASAEAWHFDQADPAVRPVDDAPVVAPDGTVRCTVPPLSAWHLVVRLGPP